MSSITACFTRSRAFALLFALLSFGSGSRMSAQNEHTLFLFNNTDGENIAGGLIVDSSGALYGTAETGGSIGLGLVFKLAPPVGSGSLWTKSILYEFQSGGTDGQLPSCTPVFDAQGHLYGTTLAGGAYGSGTIFELTPSVGGLWTESILYSFQGDYSSGDLAIDATTGALYGLTLYGTVFQLVPPSAGGSWIYNPIYSFSTGSTGGLTFDAKGNLYGVVPRGGRNENGLVYALRPPTVSGGAWTETDLYSFKTRSDGGVPASRPTLKSGVLYGTTLYGGSAAAGTVYSLSPPSTPGSPWKEAILYNFQGLSDGYVPAGGVVTGSGGTLYGTTLYDNGANGLGTVFKLTPPMVRGNPWTETVLHTFTGKGADGGYPRDSLLLWHGVFFGTTSNPGTVFSVSQ